MKPAAKKPPHAVSDKFSAVPPLRVGDVPEQVSSCRHNGHKAKNARSCGEVREGKRGGQKRADPPLLVSATQT